MKSLKEQVLDIINTAVKGKYIKKLEVFHNRGIYTLDLYLDMELSPSIVLAYEGTEDEFKEYVRKEFNTRKLNNVFFYKLRKVDPFLECADNKWIVRHE